MRKGAKTRPWTTEEIAFLRANAGKVSKKYISLHLHRSEKAVELMARRLRKNGSSVTLRHYESPLELCPGCGYPRSTVSSHGLCDPCRKRVQLEEIEGRISELIAYLPPDERDTYERTESERESRRDPMPKIPNVKGLPQHRAARVMERYERAMESWKSANLQRRIKAAQKRKERIEKKVKSMRVSKSPDRTSNNG